MLVLMVFLTGLFVAIGTGLLAGWSDFKGLTIPNLYSLIVSGAFFVTYALMWLLGRDDVFFSFFSHILGAVVVFGVTMLMFHYKAIGAADSKIGTAFALWMGLKGLFPFLFFMALFGGVLGVVALVIKKHKPFENPADGGWIAQLQAGESKVPYGIAIALGALVSFFNLGYFSSEVFASFLL